MDKGIEIFVCEHNIPYDSTKYLCQICENEHQKLILEMDKFMKTPAMQKALEVAKNDKYGRLFPDKHYPLEDE